ncbi:hypothetical protein CRYUN_Cryun39dG0066500 [Craigia yunnanensis]
MESKMASSAGEQQAAGSAADNRGEHLLAELNRLGQESRIHEIREPEVRGVLSSFVALGNGIVVHTPSTLDLSIQADLFKIVGNWSWVAYKGLTRSTSRIQDPIVKREKQL